MSDDDDEGFLSAETLRILNFYEAQYKKCAGNAAATDAALGPAQGDGGGGSEVEPQPADAGGYLKSVGRKESTARLEEQQLPTGSGELIPRSSLPLGPGVLKRFSASPPPPANDKAQRPELSVEEAYRQTIQQKDGEISVLRQRLSKVEEERIAAIQKAASHPESTKLKGLRAELDSAKHEVVTNASLPHSGRADVKGLLITNHNILGKTTSNQARSCGTRSPGSTAKRAAQTSRRETSS